LYQKNRVVAVTNLMCAKALQSLTMRPATGEDAATLTDLALRSKAHWDYSDEFIAACREELTLTSAQIEAPQFFCQVCLRKERPIAFYSLEKISTEIAELDALFVEPDLIGKGIGKMLVHHAKEQAGRLGFVTMIVQGDPHAERFYTASGAVPCGTRESGSIPGRQLPLFTIKL